MDRFMQMRVFTAVVDAGSFVAAADQLELSKAAVSRHVAALESRLGLRLLHRTTRRLTLTSEGETFHARCSELLAELDDSEAELTSKNARAQGVLKVNAPLTFGNLHLASVWGGFLERHPGLVIDLTLSDRIVDLVEERCDLAIRIGRLPDSTLVSRKLSSTRMVLCASPDYLVRHGEPKRPADLADHVVWAFSYFSGGNDWPFDGPDGPAQARIRPRLYTNSGDTCRIGALEHRCIILQPGFLVAPDLERGDLVEIMRDYRPIELGIYAVYPTRKHVPPKVRLLVEELVRSFGQRRW